MYDNAYYDIKKVRIMGKETKNIAIGIVAVAVIVGIMAMASDGFAPDTTSSLVVIPVGDNVATVDGTTIVCPQGWTVTSTVGGTPEQPKQPLCQAPNPSLETLECGDSFVDVDGNTSTIRCTP